MPMRSAPPRAMLRSRPAYRAEFLKLPSESDIARELARDVDTDAVRNARETLRATIGRADRRRPWPSSTRQSRPSGPYSPDPESAGVARVARRRARPPRRDRRGVGDRARRAPLPRGVQHDRRHRARSPSSLISTRRRATRRSTHFYTRWQDEPLVLDKWFAVQARAARARFGRDRARLLSHPEILAEEPEPRPRADRQLRPRQSRPASTAPTARASSSWPSRRSRSTRFNPHVAARLLGAFESWRILEPVRQARAKAVLEGSRRREAVHRQLRDRHKDPWAPALESPALSTGH